MRVRLRPSTAPVLPPTPTVPPLRTSKASMELLSRFRSSWAKNPSRSVSSSDIDNSRWRPNSCTASAIASSRHRLSVRNSSAEIDASSSMANAVMVWQTSP